MLIVAYLMGCSGEAPPETGEEPATTEIERALPRHVSLFGTIPETLLDPPADAEAAGVREAVVALGQQLYHDPRLSKDEAHSCNSCHALDRYGTSPEPTSGGAVEAHPPRNAPSTYNAALQFRQYWDARAESIEEAVRQAFTDPAQMGMATESAVLEAIGGIPGYREAFRAAFPGDPEPLRYGRVGQALGTYLRTLTTPASPLDRYLGGDRDALDAAELAGFEAFVDLGCVSCHSGPLIGGGMIQRLGAVHAYETADQGMGARSGEAREMKLFKVPSLRNVAETGPWFHDGSQPTLEHAVRAMGYHQLGRELTEAQVTSLVGFLRTLTGPLRPAVVEEPVLP